jgi:hypothetical protein
LLLRDTDVEAEFQFIGPIPPNGGTLPIPLNLSSWDYLSVRPAHVSELISTPADDNALLTEEKQEPPELTRSLSCFWSESFSMKSLATRTGFYKTATLTCAG